MNCHTKERNDIDTIDRAILKLIARRSSVVDRIGRAKEKNGQKVRDAAREQSHLALLDGEAQKLGLSSYHIGRIFREIVGYSVSRQAAEVRLPCDVESIRVAYLGIEGSNTHSASEKHFGAVKKRVVLKGCATFKEIFDAVGNKDADYGVVPVENTTAGSINEVYGLLYRNRLWIVGEEILPIEHCLLAVEDVSLSDLRVIVSHPQALAQCSDFLAGLSGCETRTSADTATAAKLVKEKKDPSWAAIASEEAAQACGLRVIRRHMGNQRVTSQNLKVVLVNAERNLIGVRGSVPGPKGSVVMIKEARKQ